MKNGKFNIIMIVLDGLRADRLNLCPSLSKILKKSYYFPNMITAAPYTVASFHSIFSGLYPSKNGVNSYFNMFKFRKEVCKTLPQYLQDKGYYTETNLIEKSIVPPPGIDTISVHDEYKDDLIKSHKGIISEISKKENFFLFLQYSKIHAQSVKNVGKKFDDMDKEFFRNCEANKKKYNSYLKEIDEYTKKIFDHIKNLGLMENTILVLLSDHGTSNGEKIGEKMYGSFTYDYTIKVFCTFMIPKTQGKEIQFQTRTIDIMPTLMDILEIKADDSYEHLQGKSLIPLMEGKEKEDRIAFSETGGLNGPWPSHKEHNVFCVRLKKWKLVYNKTPNTWEMYNLEEDPEEKNNVFDKENELSLKLQKILLDQIKLNKESII
jgi:arylsulfatase A-like enzyme